MPTNSVGIYRKRIMSQVTIKRIASTEQNVSLRTIDYEVYNGAEWVATFADVCDAMDMKAKLESANLKAE